MAARLALLALLAAAPGLAQDEPALPAGTQWAQLSIRERIIIRIPQMRPPPPPPTFAPPPPQVWVEAKGEPCVAAGAIAGASIVAPDRVDLMLVDGRRARALLDGDCPALDYYYGFYIRPTRDGLVCAGRDMIRSRAGAACPIRAFRRLKLRRLPPPRPDGPRP